MNNTNLTDTKRSKDWTGDEWAGDEASRPTSPTDTAAGDPVATAARSEHWNKSQYVGDQGEGRLAPQDPDTMPEGETSISGNRHADGEEHWAPDEAIDTTIRR
ncbi:MAG TPA: hypothetical protein VGK16_01345 [Candidatus Limnocylindrales bacterium]|jgi:hypothetical protein